ncbi:MAG: gamma-glutamyl-gamma-aminobutyrate hydrolase family protein, partial [Acidimicrobiaceae bacterium]|nr:gamma-glutamyl-gamma-aminobutyrate hydrolase family protein [Acidimicrobiaceae bacterium]
GITGRCRPGRDVADLPEYFDDIRIDMYFSNYAQAVAAAGGLPVHLPIDLDPMLISERLDGILLSGGTDIDPSRYGAETETDLFPPEPERDEFELSLLENAIEQQVPLLGICRGQQLVNVGTGGTLHQDVQAHSKVEVWQKNERHQVNITPGSTLHELYGTTVWVNSLHHQAVNTVGPPLKITAWSNDGIAEGLEHETLPILSVQWHPEMLPTRDTDPVFSWLVDQAHQKSTSNRIPN